MENISEVLTTFLSSGPVGVVSAAVVYVIIYLQRNKTSEKRDEDTDNLRTRVTLLEHDAQNIKAQVNDIGIKLDKITEILSELKVALASKADK